MNLEITDIKLTGAPPAHIADGLLGWVTCTINGQLRLDGIALRRTLQGHLVLSFPAKRDRTGRQHAFVSPVDDQARREIEHAVFSAISLEAGAQQ